MVYVKWFDDWLGICSLPLYLPLENCCQCYFVTLESVGCNAHTQYFQL